MLHEGHDTTLYFSGNCIGGIRDVGRIIGLDRQSHRADMDGGQPIAKIKQMGPV
jgi:hypothetical protein